MSPSFASGAPVLIPTLVDLGTLRGSRSSRPGRHVAQRDGVPSGKRRNAALLSKWAAAICPTRRAAYFCPLAPSFGQEWARAA